MDLRNRNEFRSNQPHAAEYLRLVACLKFIGAQNYTKLY